MKRALFAALLLLASCAPQIVRAPERIIYQATAGALTVTTDAPIRYGFFQSKRVQSHPLIAPLPVSPTPRAWSTCAYPKGRATARTYSSAEILARGVKSINPSEKAREKAAQILGVPVPAPVITPQLREAAMAVAGLLPMTIGQIVQQVGIPGLELAIATAQKAAKKTPSEADLETHVRQRMAGGGERD